jgi:hypothetical protein
VAVALSAVGSMPVPLMGAPPSTVARQAAMQMALQPGMLRSGVQNAAQAIAHIVWRGGY